MVLVPISPCPHHGLVVFNGKNWLSKLAGFYKTDGRRHKRLPAEYRATVSGTFGHFLADGRNLNRGGAGLQSTVSLPVGTLVFLRIQDLGVMGFAHVRHCSASGNGFLLGLQFREGLSRDREDIGNWNVRNLAQNGCRLWDEAEA